MVTEVGTLDRVGGLASSEMARKLAGGVLRAPGPRARRSPGVLLLRRARAGKELAARAVAGSWSSLLRLDWRALQQVPGETERNLRTALRRRTDVALHPVDGRVERVWPAAMRGDGNVSPACSHASHLDEERRARILIATANDIEPAAAGCAQGPLRRDLLRVEACPESAIRAGSSASSQAGHAPAHSTCRSWRAPAAVLRAESSSPSLPRLCRTRRASRSRLATCWTNARDARAVVRAEKVAALRLGRRAHRAGGLRRTSVAHARLRILNASPARAIDRQSTLRFRGQSSLDDATMRSRASSAFRDDFHLPSDKATARVRIFTRQARDAVRGTSDAGPAHVVLARGCDALTLK
jgi:hypothetical protein